MTNKDSRAKPYGMRKFGEVAIVIDTTLARLTTQQHRPDGLLCRYPQYFLTTQ